MNYINVKKFGFAVGTTAALLYLGCMLVMFTVGADGTARFFNSLLHGLDVSGITRRNMPLWEAVIGIIEIFILGWLTGACVAAIYNATVRSE
jgi:hypothetical protein